MGRRLLGRNAVVTGASSGIGRAVALALAEEGANVVVADIVSGDEVISQCRELGVKVAAHYGDIADFGIAESIIKTCVDSLGSVDILCNIAGIFNPKTIFDVSEEEWDRMIAVHLKGTFNLTRHAAPLMKRHRYGRIVNCISEAWVGMPVDLPYSTAKGGIAALTYSTARDVGAYGVTCNAVCPRAGTRDVADMRAYLWPKVTEGLMTRELFDEFISDLRASPEYMSSIVAFLCSDGASHINGCIFGTSASRLSYWAPARETIIFARDWEKQGRWTCGEVEKCMPTLLSGYLNPAPPRPEKE